MLGISTGFFGRKIQTKASTLLQLPSCRKGKLWVLHSSGEELGFLESPLAQLGWPSLSWAWIAAGLNTVLDIHPLGCCPGSTHPSQVWVETQTCAAGRHLCAWLGLHGFPSARCLIFPFWVFFQNSVLKQRVLVNFLVRIQLVLWSLSKHSLSHQRLQFGNLSENPKAPPFQDWNETWNHGICCYFSASLSPGLTCLPFVTAFPSFP